MDEIKVSLGRKISLASAERIGHGFFSDVYRIDPETVVKVLKNGTVQDAEREIRLSKWALLHGIPTAISYDVADVDGHPGMVYELLGRTSLREQLLDHPEDFDHRMRRYAKLMHSIHAAEDTEPWLPRADAHLLAGLESAPCFTEAERARMRMLLGTIPETNHIVHCDCHFKNIKVVDDELLLIDLDTLSRGDPIFDFSNVYASYVAFCESRGCTDVDPFFDTPVAVEKKIAHSLIRYYFDGLDDTALAENMQKIELLSYYIVILFILGYSGKTEYSLPTVLELFRARLFAVDDLRLQYEKTK